MSLAHFGLRLPSGPEPPPGEELHSCPQGLRVDNTFMNSNDALQLQLARYRQMTGEQRLAIALGLHELACELAREGVRRQFPTAEEAEVERRLRQRLELVRSA